MKSKKLKIISYLLVLALVLGQVPGIGLTAYAERGEEVAKIGDVTYETLPEAVQNAAEGDTIQLLQDIDLANETVTISGKKNLKLDLNGHILTSNSDTIFLNFSDLTVMDSSEAKTGMIESTTEIQQEYAVYVNESSSLTLESGTIVSWQSAAVVTWTLYSKVDITGGTVMGKTRGIDEALGTVNISGGKISCSDGPGILMRWSFTEVNVSGDAVIEGRPTFDYEGENSRDKKIVINGGYFSDNRANSIHFAQFQEGQRLVKLIDGAYSGYCTPAETIAQNVQTRNYYDTLEAACSDAAPGNTIKLLRDIEETGSGYDVVSRFTLDLNGHTITSENNEAVFAVTCANNKYGDLTIMDSSSGQTGKIINTVGSAVRIFNNNSGRAKLTVSSGTLDGGQYGIQCENEKNSDIVVNGGVIKGGTASLGVPRRSSTFTINGGYFSDMAGNEDGITRANDQMLVACTDEAHAGLFELAPAVAENEETGIIYGTLAGAVADANTGDTIRMLGNTTESVMISKNLTLDLNGKTITSDIENGEYPDYTGTVTFTGGTLTIEDSAEGGTIRNTARYGNAVVIKSGTSLVLNGGTLNGSGNAYGLCNYREATATLNGGKVSSENGIAIENYSSLTVNEGAIVQGGIGAIENAIGSGPAPTAIINGGRIFNTNIGGSGSAISVRRGSLTINGGEIYATYGVVAEGGKVTVPEGSTAVIKHVGNVSSGRSVQNTNGEFNIYGGYYSDTAGNGEKFTRPEGKTLFKVVVGQYGEYYALGEAVAENNDTGETYDTLIAAFAEAEAGQTIKLLADVEGVSDRIDITDSFTLDLNGYSVTGSNSGGIFGVGFAGGKNGDLTITDSSDGGEGKIMNTAGPAVNVYNNGEQDSMTSLTVNGGTLEGTTYGIDASRSLKNVTVTVNKGIIKGGTASVHVANAAYTRFNINGGAFSDDAGNRRQYTRLDGQRLVEDTVSGSETFGYYILQPVVAVTYHLAEGAKNDPDNPDWICASMLPVTLKDASMTDRSFQGWFTDEELADPISEITEVPAEELHLYAQFGPDKSELRQAIDEAADEKVNTPVSADGKDVPNGSQYVNQAAMDALTSAIGLAQSVLEDPEATPDEIEAAAAALDQAMDSFADAKQTATVDKSALEEAIDTAANDMNTTTVSTDGKDVPNGSQYVDQATKDTLQTAINTAQAVLEDQTASQNEIDAAKTAMDQAKQAFDNAKQTAAVDKAELQSSVESATNDMNATTVSADGKDVPNGSQYVNQAAKDALQAAINTAQSVLEDQTASQNVIDAAKTAADQAKQAFDNAKQTAAVNKTELQSSIEAASSDMNATPVSADGKDVPNGSQYVDQAAKEALQTAIEAAQSVYDKTEVTQNEVDSAKADLETAKETFDNAKQTATADKPALDEVISEAAEDKDNTAVSKDGKDLPKGTPYVTPEAQQALQEAIDAAQAVFDNENATQSEIDAAMDALNRAKEAFDAAKKEAAGSDDSGGGGGSDNPPDDPTPPVDPGDNTCKQDETCPIYPFQDSDPKAWYHDGVHWALEESVMNGTSKTAFAPNMPTTRAMIVTMLWRMEGSPEAADSGFTDLEAGSWYETAVNWAAENEIVKGYSETKFGPMDPITREQLATILLRYAQFKGSAGEDYAVDLSGYEDAGSISDWAAEGMNWCVASGIITGMTETTLEPAGSATRAQVATMLFRYCTK